ncbi:hypothetical protein M378DRAFT_300297 [Amanita muscaria Koide BX008]|uniref:Uncharacterized protein n=1 Tax=Amanita muscaria (strain Koide BX008) TaxID=946122 RepID=A0A0C2XEP0_AMAMK|nr:hypothetical protein M378DRAFT_300297 [Amanita muscaria Koide BX008]
MRRKYQFQETVSTWLSIKAKLAKRPAYPATRLLGKTFHSCCDSFLGLNPSTVNDFSSLWPNAVTRDEFK